MMEITLNDINIRHLKCFNGYDMPKNIVWKRDNKPRSIIIYTDYYITNGIPYGEGIKIAWLMEPMVMNIEHYNACLEDADKYDYIISHDLAYLNEFPEKKRVFCPGSGSSLYGYEWKVYDKNKMFLTVVGNKKITVGHNFRYKVVEALGHKIHVGGRGFNSFPLRKRAEIYAPYAFQICIHNNKVEDYWSDILIDCFATGTIPIVWGGKFLSKYFDVGGIICFDTVDQLKGIIDRLTMKDYNDMLPSVIYNKELAFERYRVAEDYLYETFFKQFDESTSDIS